MFSGFKNYKKQFYSAFIVACVAGLSACSSSSETTTTAALTADPNNVAASDGTVNVAQKAPDAVTAADVIKRSRKGVTRTGEIYLMRGLANVFSRGIDDMAVRLRDQGYDAANFSYTEWQPIAQDIIARNSRKKVSYPVIIIGHSLGGNESSKFANTLASNGVPVSLVVAFDPVETGHVGKNIKSVVNYYLPKSADNRILAKPDFNGDLKNVDVTTDPSITHTNVEKNPGFQNTTFRSIASLTKTVRPTVASTGRTVDGR